MKFNLLMAVSHDDFVARNDHDDMRWTGSADKALFKALTLSSSQPLLAGRKTYDLMPKLDGRTVVPLSRNPELGVSLEKAAELYPGAWLIGGHEVARAALQAGLVDLVYESRITGVRLKEGLPWRPISRGLQEHPKAEFWVDSGVRVRVYRVKRELRRGTGG